jgi:hypothetical protein
MENDNIQIQLTKAQALVLYEWLYRSDEAHLLPIEHPSEQKVLWTLEGMLEKEIPVFSPDYLQLLEEARSHVDATH